MSRITPKRYIFTLAILQTLSLCHISAQEYLSECDIDSKPCAKDKFLTCISNKCQCEDPLNQMYDPEMGSCVIMADRKCGGLFSTADLLDPRALENVKTFLSCGSNAACDPETSSCLCRKGFYHNESTGACDLSFGRSCINEDSIIFNSEPDLSTGNGSRTNSSSSSLPSSTSKISFLICDKSLGLHCGSEGICKCRDKAIWKIDQGCVVFVDGNNMASNNDKNNLNNNEFGNYDTSGGGNFLNLYPGFSYENSNGADEQTPFQQFIDAYTKALIDANNNYNFNQNNADIQGNNTMLESFLGGVTNNQQKNASVNKNNQYFVGDRNEFPGGGVLNQNDQQLLNLLLQQELERNGNNNVKNKNNQSDVAKLQEQAVQLQRLLIQQQQLQQLLNQLSGDVSIPQNQKNSNFATLPTPSSILVAPQNNYLGAGTPNPVQTSGNNFLWNRQQQQQPPALFGGAFPLFRIFRNFIDPIKRRLFPNLADAAYSIPSPLYIMASAVRSFLPVLRAFDQQFSPILDNVVQLTKPRQRPTSAPGTYSNLNLPLQQQIQQLLTNNNGLGLPNNQQQYQTSQTSVNGLQQRLFPGGGLLGLAGIGRGRSLNLNVGVSNQRMGRMYNQASAVLNRNRSLARKLWWW